MSVLVCQPHAAHYGCRAPPTCAFLRRSRIPAGISALHKENAGNCLPNTGRSGVIGGSAGALSAAQAAAAAWRRSWRPGELLTPRLGTGPLEIPLETPPKLFSFVFLHASCMLALSAHISTHLALHLPLPAPSLSLRPRRSVMQVLLSTERPRCQLVDNTGGGGNLSDFQVPCALQFFSFLFGKSVTQLLRIGSGP